jgi:putative transposase
MRRELDAVGWLALVDGVEPATGFRTSRRAGPAAAHEAEVDDGAFKFLVSDYLRPERPTWSSCYRRMVDDYARPRGSTVPCSRTLLRKMEREIDGRLVIARREGADALRKTLPPQQRSVAELHALELVNIDGHKFDVFVALPGRARRPADDGRDPGRLQPQDSRLAHRRDRERGPDPARLRRPVQQLGHPRGLPARQRPRLRIEVDHRRRQDPLPLQDPRGGADRHPHRARHPIHWAQPYRGQSKPIERAFRDLCDTIAKHPALAGAYTGNHIDAKPENYGERAVPIDLFVEVVERGIAAHNARPGRRTEVANGRSFDEVFEASYVRFRSARRRRSSCAWRCSPPTRCRPTASRARSPLFGNRYWAPSCRRSPARR